METSKRSVAEVKTDSDNDDVLVEDRTSSDALPHKGKGRSNSVIDSIGEGVFPRDEMTILRSKSLPTPDILSDEYGCLTSPSISQQTESLEKITDKVDAHVRVFGDDSTSDIISPTVIARMPVTKDADCYNMNHKNRGKCVIFHHDEFEMSGFSKRDGSAEDLKRLNKSFSKLNFEVQILDNLTHKEIMDALDNLSKVDHTDDDCLCIIVLTHGLQNDLISAKDAVYKSDRLWKPFTADKCPTLAGKPKLFFIQACRGDEIDNGVVLSPRCAITSTDSVSSYRIPTYSDILIAHSSAQGFYSWRNPELGTWYVVCLCEVLDEYGTKSDLLSMLTMTARKIATEYASNDPLDVTRHDKKQVPSFTSLLLRHVYFPPKTNV